MTRKFIIWLGVLSLVLAACGDSGGGGTTTTGGGSDTTADTGDTTATTSDTARRAAPAHQEVKFVLDTDFMREYEAAARRRSIVQVHWVNPPTKRVVVE